MSGVRPVLPWLARAVLRLAASRDEAPFVLDDLEQEFRDTVRTLGRPAALRWCWIQVVLSVGPLALRRITRTRRAARRRRDRVVFQPLAADLRYAWRRARRSPMVTASVIVAVAGGIGAATALVSVMESVLLRPLPFARPSEILRLNAVLLRSGRVPEVNFVDVQDMRRQAATLSAVGVYDVGTGTARLSAEGPARSVTLLAGSEGLATVLDLTPVLGRRFTPAEFLVGGPPAVLLTDRFWRQAFGRDPSVVGRSLELGSGPARVVGVLPPAADRFPAGGADLWAPLVFPATSFLNQRGSIALSAIARLAPDATVATAQRELSAIASRLADEHPTTNRGRSILIDPLQEAMVGPIRPMLLLLGGAIAVLLAVACANIANLLLADGETRTREFAVRAALGASRRRLLRQLWTETLALFAVAGVSGVLLALPLARWLVARYPDDLPLAADVQINGRVLAVSVVVTLMTAVVVGLPRVRGRADHRIGAVLGAGRSVTGPGHRRATTALVAAQVMFTMTLLFGGFVLLRTFMNVSATEPGFDAASVVAIRATIPAASRATTAQMLATQDRLRDEARAVPGVDAAAHAMFIPFVAGSWGDSYLRVGTADVAGASAPSAHFFMVSPEYFAVMGLPVVAGRALRPEDDERAPRVLVVSETFARRNFPGESALGRRIAWNNDIWEIVGVVADTRHASLWDAFDADVYPPRRQVPRGNTWLMIRTTRPPAAVLAELQRRIRTVDAGVLVSDAATMAERLAASTAPERFRALVTAALAVLAMGLAIVGVHGVIAYRVARRTREIGVRIALGERRGAVRRRIIGDALLAVGAGLIPGLMASWLLGRWMESMTMVRTDTGGAMVVVAAAFVLAAVAAAAGPAWRASRLDPVVALRGE